MIDFNHYMEFSKKFEEVLSNMKEDGKIFNTNSFGKMEELTKKWLGTTDVNIGDDDLRVLTTYMVGNIVNPEDYFKELRFLHEEIRLRGLVPKFNVVSPLMDMIAYLSHFILGNPKKAFTDEKFLTALIDSIGKSLTPDNFTHLDANLKSKNYDDPKLKKLINDLKSETELL